jgi:tetratricopeptide (TPR) repeat protein
MCGCLLALHSSFLEHNRLDEAAVIANRAAELHAKNAQVRLIQAVVARAQKNLPAAEKILQDLVTESPSDFGATNQLALVLAEQQDEAKQKRAQELAAVNTKLYPNGVEALTTMGWVQFCAGLEEEAERSLSTAVRTGQGSSDAAYYLARVFHKKKKLEDDTRKLLQAAIGAPGVFVHRADAEALLKSLGEPKKDEKKK